MDIITILKLIVCISVNTKFKSRRVIGGSKCVIKSYFRNDQRGESSSFNHIKNKKLAGVGVHFQLTNGGKVCKL